MNTPDPFEFPEVRVKTASPVRPGPEPEAKRIEPTGAVNEHENERLAREWLELWTAKREVEVKMNQLRKQIEKLLEDGEMVGNQTGYVTWETSKTLKADSTALLAAIGPQVFARVCEVSTTKLRELIQAGVVPSDADYLRFETTKRLVTKLR